MTAIPRAFLAALAFVFIQVTVSSGQDKSATNASDPLNAAKSTRAQLQEKQIDVSLEARDIERVLSKLKKASELSKQRITEAAIKAESASVSLEKGDSKAAGDEARQTAELFKEIAKQLEALLQEETPQRIAEARQMAQQLAKAERDFAEKLEEALKPMEGNGKAKGDARSRATSKNGSGGNSDENKSQNENKGKSGNEKEVDDDGDMPKSKGEIGKDPTDELSGTEKNEPKKSQTKEPRTGPSPDGSNDRDEMNGDRAQSKGEPGAKPGDKSRSGGSDKNKNESTGRDGKSARSGDVPDSPREGRPSNDQDDTNGDQAQPKGRPNTKPADKPNGSGSGKIKNESMDRDGQKPRSGGTPDSPQKGRPSDDQDDMNGDPAKPKVEPGDKLKGGGPGKNKNESADRDNKKPGSGDMPDSSQEGRPSNDRDNMNGDQAQPKGGPGGKPEDKPKSGGPGKNRNESADRDGKKLGSGDMPDNPQGSRPSKDRDGMNGDKVQPKGGPGSTPGDKPKSDGSGKNKNESAEGRPSNDPDDMNGDKSQPKDEPGAKPGDMLKGGGYEANNEPGGKAKGRGFKNGKSEPNEDVVDGGSGRGNPDNKKTEGSGGAGIERLNDKRRNSMGQALTAAERREMAAERAAILAESGKTLQDVLQEIAKSTDPGDKDSVAKIEAVTKEINIDKLVEEMSQVSLMVRSKKDGDAKLSSLDVAERLEIMAQRLDTAYRAIVAPQAEELRKVEQALLDLRERLDKLETPSQVAGWHRDLRELLNELDKLGVTLQAREQFEKEMKKMGFSIDLDRTKQNPDWTVVDGRYIVPDDFKLPLINLQEDIQQRIQTLILGDLGNISDDAMPPKYQELVERYYQVLSRQNGSPGAAKKPAPRNRK